MARRACSQECVIGDFEVRSGSRLAGIVPAYLFAHYAKSQLWHASTLLFGFFLTEACAIDPRTMGWIMAATLLLNGVADLGMGWCWRDRVRDEGMARRLQARGAPLTCAFFLLFCATPFVPIAFRPVWALAALLGFRVTYSLVDLPQNAVAGLIPLRADARCRLLAGRNVISGVAAITVGVLAAPLLVRHNDISGWMWWAVGLSALVCGTAWWLSRLPTGVHAAAADRNPDGVTGPGFGTILAALAAMIAANAMFRLIEPYFSAFADDGVGLILWAAIGGTLSQPLWAYGRHHRSQSTVLLGAATLLFGAAAFLLGPFRSTGIGVAAIGAAFGMGSGGLWLILWAAMMDRAAQGSTTRYVGTFTCVSKSAQALAILLGGHVLAGSAYRDTMRDPLSAPSLLMTGATALIGVVCLALAVRSRLNRTTGDGIPARRHPADPTARDRERPLPSP